MDSFTVSFKFSMYQAVCQKAAVGDYPPPKLIVNGRMAHCDEDSWEIQYHVRGDRSRVGGDSNGVIQFHEGELMKYPEKEKAE